MSIPSPEVLRREIQDEALSKLRSNLKRAMAQNKAWLEVELDYVPIHQDQLEAQLIEAGYMVQKWVVPDRQFWRICWEQ